MTVGIEVLRICSIPEHTDHLKAVVKVKDTLYTVFVGEAWPQPGVFLYRETNHSVYGYDRDNKLGDGPLTQLIHSTLRLLT